MTQKSFIIFFYSLHKLMDIQGALKQALSYSRYDQLKELHQKINNQKIAVEKDLHEQLLRILKLGAGMQECYTQAQKMKDKKSSTKEGLKNITYVQGSKIFMLNQGELSLIPFNFCTLFYQMKHYGKWVLQGIDIKETLCPSLYQKIGKLRLQIPLTSPRYIHLHGIGFDRVQSKSQIVVYAQQIFTDSPFAQKLGEELAKTDPKGNNKKSQICFIIKKQTNGLFMFRMVVIVDVGFNLFFVPNALARYAMQNFSQGMFNNLKRLASDLSDQQYQACIKEDTAGFYKWLKQMIQPWQL